MSRMKSTILGKENNFSSHCKKCFSCFQDTTINKSPSSPKIKTFVKISWIFTNSYVKVFFIPKMALSNISFMSDHFNMLLAKFLDISRYDIDNRYDQV